MVADVDRHADRSVAYIHVPFCSAVCPYCDFAVVAGADHLVERYVDAVIAEVGMSEQRAPLEAVNFGGGTPSHIHPARLGSILDALWDKHGISGGAEISIEANPEDFDTSRAGELAELGFTRVSFGAQSLDASVLAYLGRRHLGEDVSRSVTAAREAGFASVSVDLIYGSPVETPQSWLRSLQGVIDLGPDHVSCYALTVERGTPLSRSIQLGAPRPDPDVQADRYEEGDVMLTSAGLSRYEVSNWARPGHECVYNLAVWGQGEYEAYGNGAHRFIGGVRSRNIRRLEAYIDGVEAGDRPLAGADNLSVWEREIDRLFVGSRRTAGVVPGPGGQALLESDWGRRLVEAGVIAIVAGRLTVLRPLLTDEVHRAILDLEPPARWEQAPDPDNV